MYVCWHLRLLGIFSTCRAVAPEARSECVPFMAEGEMKRWWTQKGGQRDEGMEGWWSECQGWRVHQTGLRRPPGLVH